MLKSSLNYLLIIILVNLPVHAMEPAKSTEQSKVKIIVQIPYSYMPDGLEANLNKITQEFKGRPIKYGAINNEYFYIGIFKSNIDVGDIIQRYMQEPGVTNAWQQTEHRAAS